jgi:hypothetical protein
MSMLNLELKLGVAVFLVWGGCANALVLGQRVLWRWS